MHNPFCLTAEGQWTDNVVVGSKSPSRAMYIDNSLTVQAALEITKEGAEPT